MGMSKTRKERSMTRQDAEAAIAKYGSQRKAAKGLGVSRKTLGKAMGGKATAKPTASAIGKSLSDFRRTYDKSFIVPNKIKDALKGLGTGWEYEVVFAKSAGVSLMDLGNVRDQFADYIVSIGRESKRAWAGTKDTAQAMRKML
jgi:hypothetical protein